MKRSAIMALGETCGIAPTYRDANGQLRDVSPEAVRALLAALGHDVPTEARARDLLRLRHADQRAAKVEPVLFVPHTSKASVTIASTLPENRKVHWTLYGDEGKVRGDTRTRGRGQFVIALPAALPVNLYRVELLFDFNGCEHSLTTRLVVHPHRCLMPRDLDVAYSFGITSQLYALKGRRSHAAGSYQDVGELVEAAARAGAALVGVNPLHAMFPSRPAHDSPYAPSNRRFLDTRYLVADAEKPERDGNIISWEKRVPARIRAFEQEFECFSKKHLGASLTSRGRAFQRFVAMGGDPLRVHCLFDALDMVLAGECKATTGWPSWPRPYRNRQSKAVREFSEANGHRIAFFAFLQWRADQALARVQSKARRAGMCVGLYRDLAVGVDPGGSATWFAPESVMTGVTIGAPPDAWNPLGQNWGLAPLVPHAFGANGDGDSPFLADVEAGMRHAGALRIDHAMGLQRLFLIPSGASAADGAYLRYPMKDLMRLLAMASVRNNCLVIGEDLGTVPPGFSTSMHRAGVLSCRVLYFERTKRRFRAPSSYVRPAAASVSTHDLPTIRGFLRGNDIIWRERLGLYKGRSEVERERNERRAAVGSLLQALRKERLIRKGDAPNEEFLVTAIHRYLARSTAEIALVQLEDIAGEIEQPNVPGTVGNHPNWRRRLHRSIRQIFSDASNAQQLAAIRRERQAAKPR